MTDKKFTDEQIIKALECCSDCDCYNAKAQEDCPFVNVPFCKNYMRKQALSIIKLKKAEIEQWKKNCDELYEQMSERQKAEVAIAKRMGKAEAIKEFAKNIKEHFFQAELIEYIDSLVEEVEMGLR